MGRAGYEGGRLASRRDASRSPGGHAGAGRGGRRRVPSTADNGSPGGRRSSTRGSTGCSRSSPATASCAATLGAARIVHVDGKLGARRVAVAGIGARERVTRTRSARPPRRSPARPATYAGPSPGSIDDALPLPPDEQARALVEGTAPRRLRPGALEEATGRRRSSATLILCGDGDGLADAAAERAADRRPWANRARDLVNSPPNETHARAARRARAAEIASALEHVTAEALGPDEIRRARHGRPGRGRPGQRQPRRA